MIQAKLKRIFDLLLAMVLLFLAFPLFVLLVLYNLTSHHNIFQSDKVYNSQGEAFSRYSFSSGKPDQNKKSRFESFLDSLWVRNIPTLINVIKGDMSFVGPSPEMISDDVPLYVNHGFKPGFTCLYELRLAANIAHESKSAADEEYMKGQNFIGDIGILFRSLFMQFIGKKQSDSVTPDKINLLDIEFNNLKMESAVQWIINQTDAEVTSQIAFVNADCFNISYKNRGYKTVLKQVDRVFADGIGVHMASRMLDLNVLDNVNGTDLFPILCNACENKKRSMYLLGGRPGVVDTMVEKLHLKYPELEIAGYRHGFFSDDEEHQVIDSIARSGAHILLVAFGAPKQDLWIAQHRSRLRVGVAMGVGGLFDFVSGNIPRAPRWMREMGLEWVYRLIQEPRRMWKRYIIGNPLFLWRVWRWKQAQK
jgi:N-acetylglucosaminyldiphosphoundecaprenol N-acetyl-beta-D-mannosaminyltransferase